MVATAGRPAYPNSTPDQGRSFKMYGGHHVLFFVLRGLIVVLALWVFWRLYASRFRSRRPTRASPPDDWTEVLESIKKLPETSDPPLRADDRRRPRHPGA